MVNVLRVHGLRKSFVTEHGAVQAVEGVSFTAEQGQFYTLLGPSGCGKTTTLQCIAGLETPDEGEIELAGTLVFSSNEKVDLPAHIRDVGMVFQTYAIWPHMTVYENVAYPLIHGRRKVPRRKARDRVMDALELVELESLALRPAPFLSGGQQQRVALARALVDQPKVLLLDEPLSNLDAKLREGMRLELQQLIKRLNITTLYVTHDQVEALSMSDRIAVMSDGKVAQEGTPKETYMAPRNHFVANFVGKVNLLEARVCGEVLEGAVRTLQTEVGELICREGIEFPEGHELLAAVRPEAIIVEKSANTAHGCGVNVLRGGIVALSFYGDHVECQVDVKGHVLNVKGDAYSELTMGQSVCLVIPSDRIVLMQRPAAKRGGAEKFPIET